MRFCSPPPCALPARACLHQVQASTKGTLAVDESQTSASAVGDQLAAVDCRIPNGSCHSSCPGHTGRAVPFCTGGHCNSGGSEKHDWQAWLDQGICWCMHQWLPGGPGSNCIIASHDCCGCLPAFSAMQHHRVRFSALLTKTLAMLPIVLNECPYLWSW